MSGKGFRSARVRQWVDQQLAAGKPHLRQVMPHNELTSHQQCVWNWLADTVAGVFVVEYVEEATTKWLYCTVKRSDATAFTLLCLPSATSVSDLALLEVKATLAKKVRHRPLCVRPRQRIAMCAQVL